MSTFVIGDKDTVLGMQLVGVPGKTVNSSEEAAEALEGKLADEQVQLLFITREWAEQLRERVDRLKMTSLHPVVLEIPGRDLKPPKESIREMVRKAIGISI